MRRNLQRLWVGLCLYAKGLGVKFVKEYGSPAFLQGENHDTPTNGKRHPFATIAITSDGYFEVCTIANSTIVITFANGSNWYLFAA